MKYHKLRIPKYRNIKSSEYHTGAKIRNLSKNSYLENLIFDKIHYFKVSFFTKITFSKSHSSETSHILIIKFLVISGQKAGFCPTIRIVYRKNEKLPIYQTTTLKTREKIEFLWPRVVSFENLKFKMFLFIRPFFDDFQFWEIFWAISPFCQHNI